MPCPWMIFSLLFFLISFFFFFFLTYETAKIDLPLAGFSKYCCSVSTRLKWYNTHNIKIVLLPHNATKNWWQCYYQLHCAISKCLSSMGCKAFHNWGLSWNKMLFQLLHVLYTVLTKPSRSQTINPVSHSPIKGAVTSVAFNQEIYLSAKS